MKIKQVIFLLNKWDTEYRELSAQWSKALVITTLNHKLYDNLNHGISWLLKYVKDNNITLPDKDELLKSIQESQEIMDRIFYQPTGNSDNSNLRGNRTLKQVL